MSTKTRFEKEAKGNSEMAYYFRALIPQCSLNKTKLKICLNCTYNPVFLSSVNLVFLLCLT